MLPVYVREAEAYSMAVESTPKKPLEFKREPIFAWSNPVREGLQHVVQDSKAIAEGSVRAVEEAGKAFSGVAQQGSTITR